MGEEEERVRRGNGGDPKSVLVFSRSGENVGGNKTAIVKVNRDCLSVF